MQHFGVWEYCNEKRSVRDVNAQLKNLACLGISLDDAGLVCPDGHGMISTPLNEAIGDVHDMISEFRKETGKEKINAIFLTDGGADSCQGYVDQDADPEHNERYLGYGSRDNQYFVLRDPVSKRLLSGTGRRSQTNSLLANLGARLKINVIGFHITDRRTINQAIGWDVGFEKAAEVRSFVTKNGYAPLKEAGYDTYFLVNDKALDKEAEFESLETERTESGEIAKGKLRTQFKKFTNARKVNKMMLNEFVALVA